VESKGSEERTRGRERGVVLSGTCVPMGLTEEDGTRGGVGLRSLAEEEGKQLRINQT
jgi:hypothetical protein